MPPARPRSEKRPKRPPPTGPEMDAVAREIMAADPARRLEAVKRGERRLAGVVGDVLAQQRADEEDLLGLDLNVRRLQQVGPRISAAAPMGS